MVKSNGRRVKLQEEKKEEYQKPVLTEHENLDAVTKSSVS